MKKFQILGAALLLSVVTILLVACQKEQDGVTNEVNNNSSSETLRGVQVDASNITGMISQDAAASLAAEYAKAYGNSRNSKYTQSVTFDIKDLQSFLAILKKKGGQSVTVNFGVYNEKTAHNASQVGRLTVFFTGSSTSKGQIRSNDSRMEEFLNEGNLLP